MQALELLRRGRWRGLLWLAVPRRSLRSRIGFSPAIASAALATRSPRAPTSTRRRPTGRRRCIGPCIDSIASWCSAPEEGRARQRRQPLRREPAEPRRCAWPTSRSTGMLLEAGADANVANEDGQTPLMLAARTGNVALAKLLVQHGADVNRRERYPRAVGRDVGGRAEPCRDGGVPRVAEAPTSPSARRPTTGTTQISSEPRVQYRPTGGLTPLLYAARAGCLGCVTSMLDAGADMDRPNPDGMTPMMMALDNGYPGRRAVPARSRRQPAHLGLVGPNAALRGGDDARRASTAVQGRGRRSRWRSSRRCSMPA